MYPNTYKKKEQNRAEFGKVMKTTLYQFEKSGTHDHL